MWGVGNGGNWRLCTIQKLQSSNVVLRCTRTWKMIYLNNLKPHRFSKVFKIILLTLPYELLIFFPMKTKPVMHFLSSSKQPKLSAGVIKYTALVYNSGERWWESSSNLIIMVILNVFQKNLTTNNRMLMVKYTINTQEYSEKIIP